MSQATPGPRHNDAMTLLSIADVELFAGTDTKLVDVAGGGALSALRLLGGGEVEPVLPIGGGDVELHAISHGLSLGGTGYWSAGLDVAGFGSGQQFVALVMGATGRAMLAPAELRDLLDRGMQINADAQRLINAVPAWATQGTWRIGQATAATAGSLAVPVGDEYWAVTTTAGTITVSGAAANIPVGIRRLAGKPTAAGGAWTGWILSVDQAEVPDGKATLQSHAWDSDDETALPAVVRRSGRGSGAAAAVSLTIDGSTTPFNVARTGLQWAWPRRWIDRAQPGGHQISTLVGYGAGAVRFVVDRTAAYEQALWAMHMAHATVTVQPEGAGSGKPQISHAAVLSLDRTWDASRSTIEVTAARSGALTLTPQT